MANFQQFGSIAEEDKEDDPEGEPTLVLVEHDLEELEETKSSNLSPELELNNQDKWDATNTKDKMFPKVILKNEAQPTHFLGNKPNQFYIAEIKEALLPTPSKVWFQAEYG
ncbi:hypothetical protein DFH28DRAFT_932996 [Melampsora americana]|nr:hypothetical protein DFH28DRAFT_932996 [Melampsora americana]